MIQIRPSNERARNEISWLNTRFSFSFDQYYDPEHTQFRALRVLNEDVIAPGKGFGMHPHRDMEILTWVLEGALQHCDSMAIATVRPGELQHMSAGTGVMHSDLIRLPDRAGSSAADLAAAGTPGDQSGIRAAPVLRRGPICATGLRWLLGRKRPLRFIRTRTSTSAGSTRTPKQSAPLLRDVTPGYRLRAASCV